MNIRRIFVASASTTIEVPRSVRIVERRSATTERERQTVTEHVELVEAEKLKPASPVFLTPQSLASFPGAALAINILWNLVSVLDKNIARLTIMPIILAFIIGITIFVISFQQNMSRKDKIIAVIVAVINSAWLGLNALGINIGKPPL